MPILHMGARSRRAGLTVFLLTLAIGFTAVVMRADVRAAAARRLARLQAQSQDASVQAQLRHGVAALEVLSTLARQYGGPIPNLQQVGAELRAAWPELATLELQPRGMVSEVSPKAGYERLVGFNVLGDPVQSAGAQAAVQTRARTLSGPMRLYRGEPGVVLRAPIFRRERDGRDTFWGFVAVSMRLTGPLTQARLGDLQRAVQRESGPPPPPLPVRPGNWLDSTFAIESAAVLLVAGLLWLLVELLNADNLQPRLEATVQAADAAARAAQAQIGEARTELRQAQTERDEGRANLRQAQAELAATRTALQQAKAEAEASRVAAGQARADAERTQTTSRQVEAELVQARASLERANALAEQARTALSQARAEAAQERALAPHAEVELAQTRTALQQAQAEAEQTQAALLQAQETIQKLNARPAPVAMASASTLNPPRSTTQLTPPELEAAAATPSTLNSQPSTIHPPPPKSKTRGVTRRKTAQRELELDLFGVQGASAEPPSGVTIGAAAGPATGLDRPAARAQDGDIAERPRDSGSTRERRATAEESGGPPADTAQLRRALNQILPLLAGKDPGAKDCLADNRTVFQSAFAPAAYAEFEQCIRKREFQAAQELLRKAAKKQGIS